MQARLVREDERRRQLGLLRVGHRVGCLEGGVLMGRHEGCHLTHLLHLRPGEEGEHDGTLVLRDGHQDSALGLDWETALLIQVLPVIAQPLLQLLQLIL